MKRFLLCATLALTPFVSPVFGAQDAVQSLGTGDAQIQAVQVPKKSLEVSLKIEPLSDEQQKSGLNADELRAEVIQKLQDAGIGVNDSLMQPLLVLRIRTIQSGLDYATFFQLSLQEESMLVRNRSTFNAVTWSQASLLSCRPEDLKKEVMDTVAAMSQSFSKDFTKAIQGQSL